MTSASVYRDVATLNEPPLRAAQRGRAYVAVIGIDRYHTWNRLHNAVSDAAGALDLFVRLGFEPVGAPLFDELATGDALRRLVTDDLTALGPNDSLVLFVVDPNILPLKCASAAMEADARCHGWFGSMARG